MASQQPPAPAQYHYQVPVAGYLIPYPPPPPQQGEEQPLPPPQPRINLPYQPPPVYTEAHYQNKAHFAPSPVDKKVTPSIKCNASLFKLHLIPLSTQPAGMIFTR